MSTRTSRTISARRFAERVLRNIRPQSCGSLRLDVGEPHHLAPLLGFLGDEFAEIGGRAHEHRTAEVGKARLQLGIDKARVDLLVELLDDLCLRGLRRADAEPEARLVARPKITYRRAGSPPPPTP